MNINQNRGFTHPRNHGCLGKSFQPLKRDFGWRYLTIKTGDATKTGSSMGHWWSHTYSLWWRSSPQFGVENKVRTTNQIPSPFVLEYDLNNQRSEMIFKGCNWCIMKSPRSQFGEDSNCVLGFQHIWMELIRKRCSRLPN